MDSSVSLDEKRSGFFSRLSFYIVIMGWIGALVYVIILFDTEGGGQALEHFLSTEHSGIRFRALIFFAPFITTVIGFLLNEREKFLRKTVASQEELNRKNFELREAHDKLEKLVRQKDMFIMRLGHDLKTPLTPLVTLLPLARKMVEDRKLQEMLDANIQNVDYMKELVIKTLKLARANTISDETKAVDMNLTRNVNTYIEKRKFILDRADIRVENRIGPDINIRANSMDLEELFYNLISNSVKYSPRGALISIDARENRDGDMVTVSVMDTGLGLTAEEQEHIFDEFYKVDESRHELDSSGLGLSICRQIVESYGGMIWSESPGKGQGSTFRFTIKKGLSAGGEKP
jgi:signal transduction histidine kinase